VPTKEQKEKERLSEILKRLDEHFPEAECALSHRDPFQLMVATILSAQCTDERVNKVTPGLFDRYPDIPSLAQADCEELQDIIRSTGFFRNKAKSLTAASRKILEDHGGQIPATMEELLTLPGVARKTANVVLGTGFGIASGVVVDTHVKRISNRLGFSDEKDPVKIEQDLIRVLPQEKWILVAHQLIHFGRRICKAQRPLCSDCFLADLCPYFEAMNA